jgi:4-hydroxy-tetrahydrodipicolinate synthase
MDAMSTSHRLAGVYAAAVTPLKSDFSLDLEAVLGLLEFFAGRGCHGALLLGTTGEGPSFAPDERLKLFRAAVAVRQAVPDFRLLAGTGTPSLEETVEITRGAFESGFDGVMVLPPYYFRMVSDDGLFAWFSEVLRRAVPDGGHLFGYHFPRVSGVPLSIELLARLKEAFPNRFIGLKDSSGDPDYARQLGQQFGADLVVLTSSDHLFSQVLVEHASGCITALANLLSPELRRVWEAHLQGQADPEAQARLISVRDVSNRYPPAASFLKPLLSLRHGLPRWAVRPPLLPLPPEIEAQAAAELQAAIEMNASYGP